MVAFQLSASKPLEVSNVYCCNISGYYKILEKLDSKFLERILLGIFLFSCKFGLYFLCVRIFDDLIYSN